MRREGLTCSELSCAYLFMLFILITDHKGASTHSISKCSTAAGQSWTDAENPQRHVHFYSLILLSGRLPLLKLLALPATSDSSCTGYCIKISLETALQAVQIH